MLQDERDAAPLRIVRSKTEHAIYMVGSSRMNIAGLSAANRVHFAAALKAVLWEPGFGIGDSEFAAAVSLASAQPAHMIVAAVS